jgi:hypothetical protein
MVKVEASLPIKINSCPCSGTISPLTKNTQSNILYLKFSCKKLNVFYNLKVKYHRPLFATIVVGDPNCDDCLSINIVVHMGSYYTMSTTQATFIWVIIIVKIGVFIGCGYGSEMEMVASTLITF